MVPFLMTFANEVEGLCFHPCMFVCMVECVSVCEQVLDHNFSWGVMKLPGINCYVKIWK